MKPDCLDRRKTRWEWVAVWLALGALVEWLAAEPRTVSWRALDLEGLEACR